MPFKPVIIATDLEGVLVPEIWIAVAERTGIDALRLTTRDVPDYDQLMQQRIGILRDQQIDLAAIQAVIATLQPLPGARAFLDWARSQAPCLIVSDTFYEFAAPLMAQLGFPTLLCHQLEIDEHNRLAGYRLRLPDGKRQTAVAFKNLGFQVIAIGDSYNDTAMLGEANVGLLFRAPAAVSSAFPQLPVLQDYAELRAAIEPHLKNVYGSKNPTRSAGPDGSVSDQN